LDANATTGYEWRLANPVDDSLIDLVSSEYVADNTGLVGSGGRSVWTFKASRAGKAQISFKYIRPWEKDVPPVKEASYTVDIRGKAVKKAPDRIDPTNWGDDDFESSFDGGEPSFGENGDMGG